MRIDDGQLARRIVDGDPVAEAELCRRLLPRIRAWGLKHARDEAVALDLAQQVLVVMLEALRGNRVEDIDRIGAFVLGTCKHVLVAMRRGERRRADLLERFGPALAEVSELHALGIDQRQLAECFEKLAARARTLLALAYFADASADVIARELSMTVANVRVVRHRALAQLQACMEAP